MSMNDAVSYCMFFFKQKTAYELRISDWSSDVCSSDLLAVRVQLDRGLADRRRFVEVLAEMQHAIEHGNALGGEAGARLVPLPALVRHLRQDHGERRYRLLHLLDGLEDRTNVEAAARARTHHERSEERRVGQGCGRSG